MTNKEFSDNFSVLLNSNNLIARFGDQADIRDIVLDEYEKSVFLSKAQEEEVISLYTGKNINSESFEQTEELRRYLSNLIAEANLSPIENLSGTTLGINTNSEFFSLPDGSEATLPKVWFITYEAVKLTSEDECLNNKELEVNPVTQDEYHRIKKNPFRGPNKHRALRLDLADGVVEIVCNYTVATYYIRYIAKPTPIVLEDLEGISIDGISEETPCALHEALHQRILDRAVLLALRSKGYNINNENK